MYSLGVIDWLLYLLVCIYGTRASWGERLHSRACLRPPLARDQRSRTSEAGKRRYYAREKGN